MERQAAALDHLVSSHDTAPLRGTLPFTIQNDTALSQLDRARQWLIEHPHRDGLPLRKAASSAGVSLATMQRAINYEHTGV